MILYILKANAILLLIYIGYWIGFRRGTYYQHNRFYLLIGSLLALVLPLIQFTPPEALVSGIYQGETLPAFSVTSEIEATASAWSSLSVSLYLIVLSVLVVLFALGIAKILTLLKAADKQKINGLTLYWVDIPHLHFTFLHYIVISKDTDKALLPVILKHESVHQRELHSVDLLIAEVIKILFWYNPAAWLLKKAMAENHEFIADDAASGNKKTEYADWLFQGLIQNYTPVIANSFFTKSQLKTRLIMLHKQSKMRTTLLRYGIAIPVLAAGVFTVACTEQALEPQEAVEQAAKQQKAKNASEVDQMPEFPGGMESMITFLSENLTYPEDAKSEGVEGTVYVSFVVDESGKPTQIKTLNSLHQSLDEEAVRVVSQMPDWEAGEANGKKVPVEMKLPIKYALSTN